MTPVKPHRLKPRPGRWTRKGTAGYGGLRCDVCGARFQTGWGFVDAGQVTTTSAHVCDDCAGALT